MKRFFFIALVSWLAVEAAHQLCLFLPYRNGQFSWSSYAYDRNKQRIDQLYTISSNTLKQQLFIEDRKGIVKDSSGFIPSTLEGLVLKLAEDSEPTGHFYYRFIPIQKPTGTVPITVECSTQPPNRFVSICSCLNWIQPPDYEGAVLQLSTDQPARFGPANQLEYVRSSNTSYLHALRASPCFSTTGDGGYLKIEKNEPLSFPLKYNSKHWDLLIWKLF